MTTPIIEHVKYDIQGSYDGQSWGKRNEISYANADHAQRDATQWATTDANGQQFRVVEIRETWTVVTSATDAQIRTADARRQNEARRAVTAQTPTTCTHGNTPRPDVTGDPIKACAAKAGNTEWGAFNDEGCFYSYDCAVDVANHSAQENEDAEATPDDPFSTWGEMCPDHENQPKDGCEECDTEEYDADYDKTDA